LTVPEFFTGPANFALDEVTLGGGAQSSGPRAMVCLTAPAARTFGGVGLFFDVDAATLAAGIDVPTSIFYEAVPAIYVKGYGTMCQLSDLVTYGGDPTKFTDAGYKVNESGIPTPACHRTTGAPSTSTTSRPAEPVDPGRRRMRAPYGASPPGHEPRHVPVKQGEPGRCG
jgi:hypothetical protein